MLMLSSCYLYVLLGDRDTFNAALLSVSGQALPKKKQTGTRDGPEY